MLKIIIITIIFILLAVLGAVLKKNISAIASDVKSRLLSNESLAYQTIVDLAKTKIKKNELTENRKHVINSLNKVLPIEPSRHRNYNWYDILNDEKK